MFEPGTDPCVPPSQCEQVFYSEDDDPTKDVQGIVESDDVADNVFENYFDDDTMSVTDDDEDDHMANPYNVDIDDDTNGASYSSSSSSSSWWW